MAFLSEDAIAALGFARVGRNVKISDKASLYHPERISIADHARIDDFCILSAGRSGIVVGRPSQGLGAMDLHRRGLRHLNLA